MNQPVDNTAKGVAFACAVTFVGSSAAAASKWISNDVAVPVIVLVQYFICLLVITPWLAKLLIQKKFVASLRTEQPMTHLIRGTCGWLCFYTFYAALDLTPLVDATLLRNTAPLFVPLVALLWVQVKVPGRRWWPLLLGFVGIALILRPDTIGGESAGINIGHIIGLCSGITLAGSMVGTRILSRTENEKQIMFYYFLISFLFSLPLGIYHFTPIPLWAWPFLLYIGLSIFLAMWLYTKAYTYAPASVVSPISCFSVVISGVMGWMIWDHVPSNTALQGVLLVMGAGALTLYLSAKETPKTAPESPKN